MRLKPCRMRCGAAASSTGRMRSYELKNVDRMFVIGRGLGLAIAQEAALKFKETSGIQAEAFSSAEVRHGPMEIIESG